MSTLFESVQSKLEILSYEMLPFASRQAIVANSGDKVALVHYKYDGVGYKCRVPVSKSGEDTYLDFSKHRHNNLGYVLLT